MKLWIVLGMVSSHNFWLEKQNERSFKLQEINNDNRSLLNGIKPVGNTFVSLTGYQAQGYANIPIY